MTEHQLRRLQDKCLQKSSELTGALGLLGSAASEILGYEVVADICNGEEIEFREVDDYGVADADSTIYIEELIDIINSRKK